MIKFLSELMTERAKGTLRGEFPKDESASVSLIKERVSTVLWSLPLALLMAGGRQMAKVESYQHQNQSTVQAEYVIPGDTVAEQTEWGQREIRKRVYVYGAEAMTNTQKGCGVEGDSITAKQLHCVLETLPLRTVEER